MTLTMLKGLPASGKSTLCKEWQKENRNLVRVNKDTLREMLHDSFWDKDNEAQVLRIRDLIVRDALSFGRDVVVDDTGFAPKHQDTLSALAKTAGAEFKVHFVDTPIEECIKRDLKRPNSVGEGIIRSMYTRHIAKENDHVIQNATLPQAVIIDIDGTLAHSTERGPFEWERVGEDELDEPVARITNALVHFKRIIVSGRDGVCRPQTEEWLKRHAIQYDELHMRPKGNKEKDNLIKERILEDLIKRFEIVAVFDDRDQVVSMWRRKGLKCLQVEYGSF